MVQTHRSEYYAIITHMDRQLGSVLDALERSGKAANTYVIFTADHGLAVGEHGLMGKQNLYDHSIRMPLLISGPGLSPGRKVDELVYQHSLFPTTCGTGGNPHSENGRVSWRCRLSSDSALVGREAVFSHYRHFQRAIRTKTHKLIVYPEARRRQLFNLVSDPWEMHNLAEDPKYDMLRKDLMTRLRQMQRELGDGLELNQV